MIHLIATLLSFTAAEPKPPVGLWLGTLKVGPVELRVAFDIAEKDEKLAAKMISVDQGRAEIPCETITYDEGKLTLDLPKIKAKFTGTYDPTKKQFAGEFEQVGQKFPLVLDRVDSIPEAKRPQHPKPPYPYAVEEVTFENPAGKFTLAGTLTMPKEGGPFPAVVLVTGSGPQDRDETIMGHKPFLVIADHLTRAGFAVLRCDDRGVGQSKGTFAGATSADFATDAFAGVQFLRGRKEIDPKRVGIVGHSEGGMVGPMVAAEHPDEVAFLVLLAGPGIHCAEILKGQNLDAGKANKATDEELKVFGEFFDAAAKLAASDKDAEDYKKGLKAAAETVVAMAKEKDEKERKEVQTGMDALVTALADPWMRAFLKYDPIPVLKKVKCPVLAVNGAKDVQVRSKPNMDGIAAALKAGGNMAVTMKEFPDLNHLFQKCETGEIVEYAKIEETFNVEVLKAMTEWLKERK